MNQEIKDILITSMMMQENQCRKVGHDLEYFKDNQKLMRQEIARVKQATEREEGLCNKLDEILPKLQDTLDNLEQ